MKEEKLKLESKISEIISDFEEEHKDFVIDKVDILRAFDRSDNRSIILDVGVDIKVR